MAKRPPTREDFQASCLGKARYEDRESARKTNLRLWDRNVVVVIYRCRICRRFHLGGLNRHKRLDMQTEIVRRSRFRFPPE